VAAVAALLAAAALLAGFRVRSSGVLAGNFEVNPRRSAIDHVLALIGGSPLAGALVLRGSVTMLAWAGDRAREPGDLDFVVRPGAIGVQDRFWPYPYVDDPHRLRTAPETVHRRSRDELWAPEDWEAEGFRPRLPPEGLSWMRGDDLDPDRPHMDLLGLIERRPVTPEGVRLEPAKALFTSSYYDYDSGGGARVVVPFAGGDGSVQVDFAYDETLPEPPVLTAIPRADGALHALWTAGPSLSLAWKLQWLATDHERLGAAGGKDLFDAVLLAELPGVRLTPRLRRLPGVAGLTPAAVRSWTVEPHPALDGGPGPWLARLAGALHRGLG